MDRIESQSSQRNYRPAFYPNMNTLELYRLLFELKNDRNPTRSLLFRLHPVTVEALRKEIIERERHGFEPGWTGCK